MKMWTTIWRLVSHLAQRFEKPRCKTTNIEGFKGTPKKKTVGVVLDTPNCARRVEACHGRGARPDFVQVLKIARSKGSLAAAVAVANAGVPAYVLAEWRRIGYSPYCGLGRSDCDDSVTAKALSLGMRCDVLVLASGDHAYAPLVQALRRLGKEVVVTAVRSGTARVLLSSASEFVEIPVSRCSGKFLRNALPAFQKRHVPQRVQAAESGA